MPAYRHTTHGRVSLLDCSGFAQLYVSGAPGHYPQTVILEASAVPSLASGHVRRALVRWIASAYQQTRAN